jgi:hypothetical protein
MSDGQAHEPVSPSPPRVCSPRHNTRGFVGVRADPRSTIRLSAPASNSARSAPPQFHASDVAEASMSGVTSTALPPSNDTV